MSKTLATAALAALVSSTVIAPMPALAAPEHVYHAPARHYRHRCGGGNGAVGTIVGGAGGALIGHALVGGPVGLVAGGVGGALLGRHLDKKHTRRVHGC